MEDHFCPVVAHSVSLGVDYPAGMALSGHP